MNIYAVFGPNGLIGYAPTTKEAGYLILSAALANPGGKGSIDAIPVDELLDLYDSPVLRATYEEGGIEALCDMLNSQIVEES